MLELNNGLEQGQGDLSVHLRPQKSEARRDIKVRKLLSDVLWTLPRQSSMWGMPWLLAFHFSLVATLAAFHLVVVCSRGAFLGEYPCLVSEKQDPFHAQKVIVFNIGVLQRLTYKKTIELDQAIKSCHHKCVFFGQEDFCSCKLKVPLQQV